MFIGWAMNILFELYSKLPTQSQLIIRATFRKLGILNLTKRLFSWMGNLAGQQAGNYSDLSWKQFSEQILRFRDDYKGVFIQHIVIPWHTPLFQRPQQIARALGRQGFLVVYQTDRFGPDSFIKGFHQVEKNVWLTPSSEALQIPNATISTYSTSDSRMSEIAHGQKVIYEYVDHIDAQISGKDAVPALLEKKNQMFRGAADIVVTTAEELFNEAKHLAKTQRVENIPNGVDFGFYAEEILKNKTVKNLEEFSKTYSQIVGYFGAIAPWLWSELINEVTESMPNVGFVFIGPDYAGGMSEILPRENVLMTGAVDHKEIPTYGKYFDVAIIPFRNGDIAKTTSPLKLFEYFALQKPVIVTPDMKECTKYPQFVAVAGTREEMASAITRALNDKKTIDWKNQIHRIAEKNSWVERAIQFEEIISNG
jgi:glycosyltransferase involved in cell wall biosynthesis